MKRYENDDFRPVYELINKMVGENKYPSGIFGVADKVGIIGVEAYGEYPVGRKIKEDDIYPLFSVTKLITGLAIMQLWEQGKLHLNEYVSKYVPGFEKNGKDKITIWHLLTHTSGLTREDFNKPGHNDEAVLLKNIIESEPENPCGQFKCYNALNSFFLLGVIIKAVSGLRHTEYMDRNIFKPLNMKDTSFDKHREVPERLVPVKSQSEFDMAAFCDMEMPGGGLMGTAGDLLTLGTAILNEGTLKGYKLISPRTIKAMTTPQTTGIPYFQPGNNMTGIELGLAWMIPVNRHSIICHNIFGHNGAGDCMLWVYPEEGLVFTFLTNYDFDYEPDGCDIEYIHNVVSSCLK